MAALVVRGLALVALVVPASACLLRPDPASSSGCDPIPFTPGDGCGVPMFQEAYNGAATIAATTGSLEITIGDQSTNAQCAAPYNLSEVGVFVQLASVPAGTARFEFGVTEGVELTAIYTLSQSSATFAYRYPDGGAEAPVFTPGMSIRLLPDGNTVAGEYNIGDGWIRVAAAPTNMATLMMPVVRFSVTRYPASSDNQSAVITAFGTCPIL